MAPRALLVCPEVRGSFPVRARIRASVARFVAHHAFSAASRISPASRHCMAASYMRCASSKSSSIRPVRHHNSVLPTSLPYIALPWSALPLGVANYPHGGSLRRAKCLCLDCLTTRATKLPDMPRRLHGATSHEPSPYPAHWPRSIGVPARWTHRPQRRLVQGSPEEPPTEWASRDSCASLVEIGARIGERRPCRGDVRG